MRLSTLAAAALVSAVSAQNMNMNLTALLSNTSDLSTLAMLVQAQPQLLSNLAQAQNITILAPSNAAFAKLGNASLSNTAVIPALLSYHVINGTFRSTDFTNTPVFAATSLMDPIYSNVTGGQRVEIVKSGNDVNVISGLKSISKVTLADQNFTGGVVHVIDTVLTLPQNVSSTAIASNLTALAGALGQTNLVNAVDTTRDVTIFAPNNEAFQRIGSALPNLTTQQLAGILTYHVVNGTVAYSSTLSNMTVRALNGGELNIRVQNGSVYVNSAKVVVADVLVANGVVHVIDNVLNPNNTSAMPDPAQQTQSAAFAGASSASSVPFTSGVPTPTSTLAGVATASATATAQATSSTSRAAAAPMKTAGVGMAALMGAGAALLAL
jgi:uncharacterized surface protein with fasciclin (FAS1) repeats